MAMVIHNTTELEAMQFAGQFKEAYNLEGWCRANDIDFIGSLERFSNNSFKRKDIMSTWRAIQTKQSMLSNSQAQIPSVLLNEVNKLDNNKISTFMGLVNYASGRDESEFVPLEN